MSSTVREIINSNRDNTIEAIIQQANRVILGKDNVIRLALACIFARGHLLIEDLPGVGKTTLSHVLANVLGLSYQRIQFTSDLLPADILGVSVYNRDNNKFSFHPGPVFNQLVLADEVNRATPRAQSALLEAMEERQVTIEGTTRGLPEPFFVIATQNPSNQVGTFPLPESQLDRFMMCLNLGYPDTAAERELLLGRDRREILGTMTAIITPEQLINIQQKVEKIHAADAILDYLQNLLEFSRQPSDFINGLSPRAGIAILHAAKAWALIEGHNHILPEDIQAILGSVIGHRLRAANSVQSGGNNIAQVLIDQVPLP